MFYVSDIRRSPSGSTYGITDSEDGVTEYYTKEDLVNFIRMNIRIKGIENGKIRIVNAGKEVIGSTLTGIERQIKMIVNSYTYAMCEEVARKAHFVRQVKALKDDMDAVHQLMIEKLYPESIKNAVQLATTYTNSVHSVDVTDRNAVMDALNNNMCLVMQLSSKGSLTAFIGTANLGLLDKIYGKYYFDTFALTKLMYSYTYNIASARLSATARQQKPNLVPIFSGALRFDYKGVHHDGDTKVLRSTYYSVNTDSLFAIFVLDNPSAMRRYNVVMEYEDSSYKGIYEFDMNLWEQVENSVKTGNWAFQTKEDFLKYIPPEALETKSVELTAFVSKAKNEFEHMQYVRKRGLSYGKE